MLLDGRRAEVRSSSCTEAWPKPVIYSCRVPRLLLLYTLQLLGRQRTMMDA